MQYTTTRGAENVRSAQAITRGIAADGGLFVPRFFPVIDDATMKKLIDADYVSRAKTVLAYYLTDFTAEEIGRCVERAYTGTFERDEPAPLVEVRKKTHFLELWHGPSCAFKDLALQLLPELLATASGKVSPGKTNVILVATSGDTGKAALDGFSDVPGTKIIVFYPRDGVSEMQKLQMTTQRGNNVAVCGIAGNFDHAQSGVKAIFSDDAMRRFLADRNFGFSSANSINFGRLVPQIVYYVSAYCDLVRAGKLRFGESFNVAVPTGNFGDILAAFYAGRMGVPVKKFICASNRNAVLSDFISSGVYDRNRAFHTTISPSMDILVSSNLERLLYTLSGDDASEVDRCMRELKENGRYQISAVMLEKLQTLFYGGSCDDDATRRVIGKLFSEFRYLADPHTAVAAGVLEKYRAETGDDTLCVVVSTASPYKFAQAVLPAVGVAKIPHDPFESMELLSATTGTVIPAPLRSLKGREILHRDFVEPDGMAEFVRKVLA